MRIGICGYEEHDELADYGWSKFAWKTSGGYANQSSRENVNAKREVIWFSPNCLNPTITQRQLFAEREPEQER